MAPKLWPANRLDRAGTLERVDLVIAPPSKQLPAVQPRRIIPLPTKKAAAPEQPSRLDKYLDLLTIPKKLTTMLSHDDERQHVGANVQKIGPPIGKRKTRDIAADGAQSAAAPPAKHRLEGTNEPERRAVAPSMAAKPKRAAPSTSAAPVCTAPAPPAPVIAAPNAKVKNTGFLGIDLPSLTRNWFRGYEPQTAEKYLKRRRINEQTTRDGTYVRPSLAGYAERKRAAELAKIEAAEAAALKKKKKAAAAMRRAAKKGKAVAREPEFEQPAATSSHKRRRDPTPTEYVEEEKEVRVFKKPRVSKLSYKVTVTPLDKKEVIVIDSDSDSDSDSYRPNMKPVSTARPKSKKGPKGLGPKGPAASKAAKKLAPMVASTACHSCRTKGVASQMACSSCPLAFCASCIHNRYDVVFDASSRSWTCPYCLGYCSCDKCMEKRGTRGRFKEAFSKAGYATARGLKTKMGTSLQTWLRNNGFVMEGGPAPTGAAGAAGDQRNDSESSDSEMEIVEYEEEEEDAGDDWDMAKSASPRAVSEMIGGSMDAIRATSAVEMEVDAHVRPATTTPVRHMSDNTALSHNHSMGTRRASEDYSSEETALVTPPSKRSNTLGLDFTHSSSGTKFVESRDGPVIVPNTDYYNNYNNSDPWNDHAYSYLPPPSPTSLGNLHRSPPPPEMDFGDDVLTQYLV